ncbi:MAG: EF-hand domain-containing protein [Rubricoccaceae bacterium]|nr:EF-hand domain-containing protein [Rubricoccaceae bacterium]
MSTTPRFRLLPAVVLPLTLALALSGCTLLGLGAAAGAAVGGCAILDTDDDNAINEAELSAGLFDAWDTDGDGVVSMTEFNAGVSGRPAFADVADDFDAWDTDNSGTLTEAELSAGIAGDSDFDDWADATCDDLGL